MRIPIELCYPLEIHDLYFKLLVAYQAIASARKQACVKFEVKKVNIKFAHVKAFYNKCI